MVVGKSCYQGVLSLPRGVALCGGCTRGRIWITAVVSLFDPLTSARWEPARGAHVEATRDGSLSGEAAQPASRDAPLHRGALASPPLSRTDAKRFGGPEKEMPVTGRTTVTAVRKQKLGINER